MAMTDIEKVKSIIEKAKAVKGELEDALDSSKNDVVCYRSDYGDTHDRQIDSKTAARMILDDIVCEKESYVHVELMDKADSEKYEKWLNDVEIENLEKELARRKGVE